MTLSTKPRALPYSAGVCARVCVCDCVRVCACAHAYVWVCMLPWLALHICTHICSHTHGHLHTYARIHKHTNMLAYSRSPTHKHLYTNTRILTVTCGLLPYPPTPSHQSAHQQSMCAHSMQHACDACPHRSYKPRQRCTHTHISSFYIVRACVPAAVAPGSSVRPLIYLHLPGET